MDLEKLETLDIGYNNFTTLPESITKLTSLQTLNLEYNQLTPLPESIKKMEERGVTINVLMQSIEFTRHWEKEK